MIQDDANDWFQSQGQQIQDYEAPEAPEAEEPEILTDEDFDPDRPYGDVPQVTNDDLRNVSNMRAIAQPTAAVIVGTLDVLMPLAITLLIRGSDSDQLRLSDSERDTLTEAWATYLGDKNIALSPGVALLVAMLTIYGSKIVIALDNRRQQQQLQAALDQADTLRRQLAEERRRADDLQALIASQAQQNATPQQPA